MSDIDLSTGAPLAGRPGAASTPSVVVQNIYPKTTFGRRLLWFVLLLSLAGNLILFGMYQTYYPQVTADEQYKHGDRFATDKIAVIKVTGPISGLTIAAPKREFETAAKDNDVRAIVLAVVDCPGGTISGSDELFRAVEDYKRKTNRPVVVSMQELAASGAYYISTPADLIYADRSCVTGSIGVIASMFNVESLLKEWGVKSEVFKSGSMKDSGSPFRSMNPEERKEWQKMIDQMYEQFLDVVLKHRDAKIGGRDRLKQIADGRVYLATEARQLGLIDEIGYEEDAIEAAKKLAGLTGPVRVVTYSRPIGNLVELLGLTAQSEQPALDASRLLDFGVPRMYLLPGNGPLVKD